jgi:TrmH family RNA methyltransferase
MRNLHVTENFELWQSDRRIIMLDEIRDPGNLGTIMRTAEAMGYRGIILSRCADIYNPKTIRAAMGGIFRLPLYVTDDGAECAKVMKAAGRRVIAAALGEHTLTLGGYEIAESDCAVIGNEGHGISDGVLSECTACVRIPMQGLAESLNASVAASCIMWEYSRHK